MDTPSPQAPIVVFDEFGYYCGGQNDSLKEDLRTIDGVPNATYLVKGRQVFVFDKLVQLVAERQERQPNLPLADLARSLVVEATVSAKEAVEAWGVVPEPYEVVEHPVSGLVIRHRPFNAVLPGIFQNKSEMQDALAGLLLGDIQPGGGGFVYRGQPMTLCEPLDIALLPPQPAIRRMGEPEFPVYTALGDVVYGAGFAPVPEVLFDKAKALETAWRSDIASAAKYTQEHIAEIWARTAGLQLETLDDPTDEVPEYGQEDFAELRPLYPELPMLSDGSLYAQFAAYQIECCYLNGWTACRDDAFLFYLLGKVAGHDHDPDRVEDVGQGVAYALLRGDSLDDALAFGLAANSYDKAISLLARRIANAMRFVVEDKKTADLQGAPITTLLDGFRAARIFCVPFAAEQNISDLDTKTPASKRMKP